MEWLEAHSLLGECLVQKPDDDWEVATFIVGWQEDGVLVSGRHGWRSDCDVVQKE